MRITKMRKMNFGKINLWNLILMSTLKVHLANLTMKLMTCMLWKGLEDEIVVVKGLKDNLDAAKL